MRSPIAEISWRSRRSFTNPIRMAQSHALSRDARGERLLARQCRLCDVDKGAKLWGQ
jgi:hypothetical protein